MFRSENLVYLPEQGALGVIVKDGAYVVTVVFFQDGFLMEEMFEKDELISVWDMPEWVDAVGDESVE